MTEADNTTTFLTFDEARAFARMLGLRSQSDWIAYVRSGKKPENIPSDPRYFYQNDGWQGMPDFLGYSYDYNKGLPGRRKQFLSFKKAREFVRKLGLSSEKEWFTYARSKARPANIPSDPRATYSKQGWKGYPDFLGVESRHPSKPRTLEQMFSR